MLKRIAAALVLMIVVLAFSGKPTYSDLPPGGYTGELGFSCQSCHNSYAENSGGGSVVVTGLPTGSYTTGQEYPVSVTINHPVADRLRWGFQLAARNFSGEEVGSFIPGNNSELTTNMAEIGHYPAAITSASNSYTFTGMKWKAPANPTPNDYQLRFFVAGNAANFSSNSSGDYIYTTVIERIYSPIPVTLTGFTATAKSNYSVELNWATAQEQNSSHFMIEHSADGQQFAPAGRVAAAGNTNLPKQYRFTDNTPLVSNGKAWYRLKQVDINGQVAYSATVAVSLKTNKSFVQSMAPNPVKPGEGSKINIVLQEAGWLTLQGSTAGGSVIYTHRKWMAAGLHTVSLPVLTPGAYYFSIQAAGLKEQRKLLVQ